MIADNLGPAFRISLVPFGIVAVAYWGVVSMFTVSDGQVALPSTDPIMPLLAVIALLALTVTLFCLVAVAWHRFVLLEEQPGSLGPRWNGAQMLAYAGASLRIGLVMFAIGAVVGLGLGLFFAMTGEGRWNSQNGATLSFLVNLAMSYLSMRFALVLPAAALGERMQVFDSWSRTKPFAGAIFVAAGCAAVLVNLPLLVIGTALGSVLAQTAYFLFAGWLQIMLSISVLTALYGHIVEGRPLR